MSAVTQPENAHERMDVDLFFERAKAEAARYGTDTWIFLRELIQNSRDAGANQIQLDYQLQDGWAYLSCNDNGCGMDQEAVDKYLLRLYASSKESETEAVGFFGVGFWSSLLWKPEQIMVQSWNGKSKPVNFVIDCSTKTLQERRIEPALTRPGTRICLVKKPTALACDPVAEIEKIRERARYYAGHIRPLRRKAIELSCGGVRLNCEFAEPEYVSEQVRCKHYDGVLGFGKTPMVRIYKGGILVRDLTSLDELIPSRTSLLSGEGWGIAPHVLINIEGLKVLIDRTQVFEDPELLETVKDVELRLIKMRDQILSTLYPTIMPERAKHFLWRLIPGLAIAICILLSLWLGSWLLERSMPDRSQELPYTDDRYLSERLWDGSQESERSGTKNPLSLDASDFRIPAHVEEIATGWDGASLEKPRAETLNWQFEHDAPDGTLFRSRSFTRFQRDKGLGPQPIRVKGPYSSEPQQFSAGIQVKMAVKGDGKYLRLPVPPGYEVDPASVILADEPLALSADELGEALVRPTFAGNLSYRCQPSSRLQTSIQYPQPGYSWSEPFYSALLTARKMPTREAVEVLSRCVWLEMKTDYSSAFRVPANQDWVAYVMKQKKGDCDILNGLLVLLLREAGISAHLEVGMVAYQGRVRSDLHAWTRFYDEGWHDFDISESTNASLESLRLPSPNFGVARGLAESYGESPSEPTEPAWQAPPDRAPVSSRDWGLAVWLALPLVLLALFFLYKKIRPKQDLRKNQLMNPHPELFRDLLLQHLQSDSQSDKLLLFRRSAFVLTDGRKVSLEMLLEQRDRQGLFSVFNKCRLLEELEPGQWILDRRHSSYKVFRSLLPYALSLDRVSAYLKKAVPNPDAQAVEAAIRRYDPDFRLHYIPRSKRHYDAILPFLDPEKGQHHFFLAARNSDVKQAVKQKQCEIRRFELARIAILHCSFYHGRQVELVEALLDDPAFQPTDTNAKSAADSYASGASAPQRVSDQNQEALS